MMTNFSEDGYIHEFSFNECPKIIFQTWAFLDRFQILAGLSRAQKKQSSEFTEFSTKT